MLTFYVFNSFHYKPLTTVKRIRSFLGHSGFYRRFIRDFSKIAKPLCRLLEKDAKYNFDESWQNSFEEIKSRLVEASIMAKPNWNKEFEIMCDASNYAMGAVLGQKDEKVFRAIYYSRKTFNKAQENYSTTEKEMLAMVFACEKFRPYILRSHVIIHTDCDAPIPEVPLTTHQPAETSEYQLLRYHTHMSHISRPISIFLSYN